jgi:hypothetical protein
MLPCSRGAFSPISQSSAGGHKRASPQRKGPHGGSQVQGSLLEYSEFTAGNNTSVGSGLGMDDILGMGAWSQLSDYLYGPLLAILCVYGGGRGMLAFDTGCAAGVV